MKRDNRYAMARGRWHLPTTEERERTLATLREENRNRLDYPKGETRLNLVVWTEDLRRIRRMIGAPKNAPPSFVVRFLINALSGFTDAELLNRMFSSSFPALTRRAYDVFFGQMRAYNALFGKRTRRGARR